MGLTKIIKQFLNLTFLEGILTLKQVCFFKSAYNTEIVFISYCVLPFSRKNKFTSQKDRFSTFFDTKTEKNRNTTR